MKFHVKINGRAVETWNADSEAELVTTLKSRGCTIREVGEPKEFGNIEWTQRVPDASERGTMGSGPQKEPVNP